MRAHHLGAGPVPLTAAPARLTRGRRGERLTENIDPAVSPPSNRVAPKRLRVPLAELALIVRPPGRPAAIRAFTAAEATEARAYAEATGATVEQLEHGTGRDVTG